MDTVSREFPVPKEQITKRVNLDAIIEQLLSGTYKPEIDLNSLDWNSLEPEEALEIWHALKPERNAILAILVTRIWNNEDFKRERGEILEESKKIDLGFGDSTRMLFGKYTDSYFRGYNKGQTDPIIERYLDIMAFGGDLPLNTGPADEIIRGIGTATFTSWYLMRVIVDKYTESHIELNVEKLMFTARRAVDKIVVLLASMNQDVAVQILERIRIDRKTLMPRFDPAFFDLIKEKDDYILQLNRNKLMNLKNSVGGSLFELPSITETTWCPARYHVGGNKSVIKEYLDWILEIAEKRYFPYRINK